MSRVHAIRSEVLRLMRSKPFQPFALSLENGDRIIIEHPENIAFDPTANGDNPRSQDFYVISKELRVFSSFNAVTSVTVLDRGE